MRHHRIPGAVAAFALIAALVTPTAAGGATAPSEWPASVAPIAKAVERAWGARFDHPVPVRFLSDRAFRKEVTADESDLTKAERRDITQTRDELAAFGLVSPDADLLAQTNEVSGEGVLAYYDSKQEEIVVRGRRLDVEARVTLAHELTHALQDQRVDLDRVTDRADARDGSTFGIDALSEGDATYIEDEYIARLSDADYAKYDRAQSDGYDAYQQSVASVPEIVQAISDAPYVLGPGLAAVARARGGHRAVESLFRDPPRTEAEVLSAGLDRHREVHVARPRLVDGERRIGTDDASDFGALTMFSVLASRIDARTALDAANSWGGAASVTFRRGDRTCVRTAFAERSIGGLPTLEDAWNEWAATMPPGTATVTPSASRVTVESCTPTTPVAPTRSVQDALDLLSLRHEFAAELVTTGARNVKVWCMANVLAQDPVVSDLVTTLNDNPDDEGANTRLAGLVLDAGTNCPNR